MSESNYKAYITIDAGAIWRLAPLLNRHSAVRDIGWYFHVEPAGVDAVTGAETVICFVTDGWCLAALRCSGRATASARLMLPKHVVKACAPPKLPALWDEGEEMSPPAAPDWLVPNHLHAFEAGCFVSPRDDKHGLLANAIAEIGNAWDTSRDYRLLPPAPINWRKPLNLARGQSGNVLFQPTLFNRFRRLGAVVQMVPGEAYEMPWLLRFFRDGAWVDGFGAIMPYGQPENDGEVVKASAPLPVLPDWVTTVPIGKTVGSA